MKLEAVCFDYWNTLMHEDGRTAQSRRDAWAVRLGAIGIAVADHELDVAFEGAWRRFTEAWQANRQYVLDDAARDLLADLHLGHLDAEVHELLVADLHEVGQTTELSAAAGIEGCLRRLREAGMRLGIICDVGMTPSTLLRGHLERHGLLDLFDHWSFSDDVGWYKPAPEIFEHALRGLGADPARAAHVGDLRRTDVAGAQAMGMLAVRYRGLNDDRSDDGPEADVVCDHHDDLPALLGIGS